MPIVSLSPSCELEATSLNTSAVTNAQPAINVACKNGSTSCSFIEKLLFALFDFSYPLKSNFVILRLKPDVLTRSGRVTVVEVHSLRR